MDQDGNGEVDKREFLQHMLVRMGKVEEQDIEEITALFDTLDADGSGTIGPEDAAVEMEQRLGSRQASATDGLFQRGASREWMPSEGVDVQRSPGGSSSAARVPPSAAPNAPPIVIGEALHSPLMPAASSDANASDAAAAPAKNDCIVS